MPPQIFMPDLLELTEAIERYTFEPEAIDPWHPVDSENQSLTVVCEDCGCQYESRHPNYHIDFHSFAWLYNRSHTFPQCPVCRRIRRAKQEALNAPEMSEKEDE